MNVLHVFAGLTLFGLSVYTLVQSLRRETVSGDLWKVLSAFTGLLLAFVLFTGFVQLGSRHEVPSLVLYKLGTTVLGGVLLLASLIFRIRGIFDGVSRDLAVVVSVFLFGISLYLGIVI